MRARRSGRNRVNVNTSPVADRYAGPDERIVEFSSPEGGGLVSFMVRDGKLIVDLYRLDDTVEVRVPGSAVPS